MNVLTIVVILVITTAGHVHCRLGVDVESTTTVHVENDLKVDTVLILHCRSTNNDVGEKTLHSGQTVEWSFQTNPGGTTLYSCDIKWNNEQHKFVIYDSKKDEAMCTSKCMREISPDGVYFFNEFKNTWVKRVTWN
ncbi:leguminosin group486 secreted peptide [Medicago truncatula]|nr:leguminosin group486 secreted peptide [Medicago truncatula]KEH20938.1 leguminosin group486 secreted peptide [Medicago truncatula]